MPVLKLILAKTTTPNKIFRCFLQLDRPGKDDMTKHAIVVNELIDANDEKYASGDEAATREEQRCLCMSVGHIRMNVDINRKCFCPGEVTILNFILFCILKNPKLYLQTLEIWS